MRQKTFTITKQFDEVGTTTNNGLSIEQELRDRLNNELSSGLTETSPIIFTPRKDGILPEYNIRTDRWEIAQAAMDKVAAYHIAKREEFIKSTEPNIQPTGNDTTV